MPINIMYSNHLFEIKRDIFKVLVKRLVILKWKQSIMNPAESSVHSVPAPTDPIRGDL